MTELRKFVPQKLSKTFPPNILRVHWVPNYIQTCRIDDEKALRLDYCHNIMGALLSFRLKTLRTRLMGCKCFLQHGIDDARRNREDALGRMLSA